MKIHVMVWKAADGGSLLSWEIGTQKARVNAYECERPALKNLRLALEELDDMMDYDDEDLARLMATLPPRQEGPC
jgi:hypothetical protein